ncbi:hypothetical protein CSUI_005137, partial [Cystoisospora suis]
SINSLSFYLSIESLCACLSLRSICSSSLLLRRKRVSVIGVASLFNEIYFVYVYIYMYVY